MSKILDERVVSMQFDNAQFEKNVGTSLNTLDKLQKKLNLTGMSKGLESVDAAAKKCNFAPMSQGIDTVRLKFSAMYTTADHYFRKLLTTVDNFATKFAKSLTIDPVSTGLKEYETQIGAIQTILANTESKGTTLDDVNAALDELNKYADMTIYNFTEMTRNIGTFTAAGVELDTSVSAIKGIANLAAVSGSTSQQASTAMYQLSQALAAGRVSLMDWNSVVNAGMGGEVFQNALKRTATVMGTDVEAIIEKYGSFRESLTQGEWLTTDVLTKTLEQFTLAAEEGSEQWNEFKRSLMDDGYTEKQAEEILKMANTATDAATKVKTATQLMDVLKEAAQSGWTQTWEYIIGDFEQAKEMWTAVSDELTGLINKMSENRNNLLLGGALNPDTGKMEYFANAGLMSNYDKLITKINEAGVSTENFEESVKKTAKEHGYPIDQMIKNYGDLETAIRKNQLPTKVLNEALENLSGTAADLSKIGKVLDFGDTGDDVKEMQQALVDLGYNLDEYGIDGIIGKETTAAIKAFQEAKGLEITGILDEATLNALKEATKGVEGLSGECADLIANIDKLGGRELLVEAFANAWTAVKDVFGGVKEAWREVFPAKSVEEKSTALYNIIESIHGFSEKLLENEEVVDNLKRTFKGLFSVLEIVKTVLGGGIGLAFKTLTAVLGKFDLHILDVAAAAGDVLTKFRDWIFENEAINKGFDLLVDGIAAGAIAIRDWVKAFLELPQVSKVLTGIRDFFSGGFDRITEFIARFKKLKELGNINWGTVFKDFRANVIGYFTNFEYGGVFKGVKTFFTNLKNKVSEYFEGFDITGSFTVVFNRIREFFSGGFERVTEFVTRFKKLKELGKIDWGVIFKDFKTNVLGYFTNFDYSGILTGIKTFFTNLKNGVSEYFKNFDIKTTFITVVEKIRTFFSDLFGSIGTWFNGLNLGTSFDKVRTKVSGIFEFIKDILPSLIGIGAGAATFYGIFKTIGFIKDVLSPIANITEAVNNISDSIEGLAKAKSKSMKMQALGQMLLMIGGSILMIAKAIEMLGSLDTSVIKQGGIAVGIITGVIAGMMILSKFLADGYKSFEFGSMVLKISASIFVLAYAIKMLGTLDPSTLKQGMETITAFLLGIVGMMAATKLLGGDSDGFGKMMFKLASSLLILSLVIKILGGMEADKLEQGMKAIASFMGIMALMMLATKLLTKDKIIGNSKTTNTFMQFGKMMLALSASLLLMAAAVTILGKMDRETLVQGGIVIITFLGMMVGMMAATKLLAKDMPKFAGMVSALGASLLLMTASVAILGNMDSDTIIKGTIAVAALLGMMVGMMAATKLIGSNAKDAGKVGVMMLAFSGAMIIMAGAIKILSGINTKDLAAATLAISAVGGIFAVMTQATKYIKGKTMGTLIVLTVAVGLLATALYVLADLDTKKLLGASAALTIVMGAFAVMTAALKTITGKDKVINGKTLLTLGIMAGIVGALGLVVYLLTKNIDDPDGALKSAIALSAIIVALSGACAALSIASKYAPKTKKGLIMLAGVMGLVGGFAAVAIWQLPNVAKQLSSFMTELEPFIKGVKGLDQSFLNALKTLAEAILILTGAGGIFAVADTISLGGVGRAFDTFKTFIKEAVPVVKDIALEVSGQGVTINTKNLTAIIDAVKGLAEAASMVPSATAVMAGGNWGAAMAFNFTWLDSFTTFITDAVTALKDIALEISASDVNINTDDLTTIVDAVGSLADAASKVPSVSIAVAGTKWGGGASVNFTWLDGFTKFITDAVGALTGFVMPDTNVNLTEVSEDDIANLKSICEVLTPLAEAADAAPDITIAGAFSKFKGGGVGGVAMSFPGLREFTNFVSGAVTALVGVTLPNADGVSIGDVKEDDIANLKSICEVLTPLAEAADAAPSITVMGGFAKFAGGFGAGGGVSIPGLTNFVGFIEDVIPAISSLTVTNIKGSALTEEDGLALKSICEAVKYLGEAAGAAPGIGIGVGGAKFATGAAFFTGIDVPLLGKFTEWISEVMPKMTDFTVSAKTVGITEEDGLALKSVCEAVKYLGEAAGAAPGIGVGVGGAKFATGAAAFIGIDVPLLGQFTEWIKEVMPKMSGFTVDAKTAGITEADGLAIQSVCTAVKILAEAAEAAPGTEAGGALGVIGPVIGAGGYIKHTDLSSFTTWISEVMPAVTEQVTEFKTAGITEEDGLAIQSICKAVKILAEAADDAPKDETYAGLGGVYVSRTNLDKFKAWLVGDGTEENKGVVQYLSEVASGISGGVTALEISVLTSICTNAKTLCEAAKLAPKQETYSNIFGTWTSVEDLSSTKDWMIGTVNVLKDLALGLATDADGNEIDVESLMTNMSKIQTIANAAKTLSSTVLDVVVAQQEGGYDTDTLSSHFQAIGMAMSDFATEINEIEDIDVGKITALSTAAYQTSTALLTFSSIPYESIPVDEIGSKLEGICTEIDAFATDMSGITGIPEAAQQIRELSGVVGGLTEISFTGASSFQTALEDLGKTGIEKFIEKFDTSADDVKKAANGLVDKAASAIESKSNYNDMKSAGKYLGKGLVKGIEAKYDDVYNAAYKLGRKAVQGEKDGQKSKSPSKETIKAGHWFGEGLVIGIAQMGNDVYKAGYSMADSAKTGLSKAISNISALIDSDMDTQPTIRPVLDMSDVKSGLSSIDGILNNRPSIGVMSNVGMISTMMNNRQNGTNNDVISAINDLGRSLGKRTGDTYQINGITYDDGSNINEAVKTLVRAARVERRI